MDKTRTITFTPERPKAEDEICKAILSYVERDKLTIAEVQWIFDEIMNYMVSGFLNTPYI